jgi:hypothetical protein
MDQWEQKVLGASLAAAAARDGVAGRNPPASIRSFTKVRDAEHEFLADY